MAAAARVGVDVGGTFTDVVLVDDEGAIHTWKLPSTPDDFSQGVIDGVAAVVREHEVSPTAVRDVVHGSTVATNAILERRGARTGLTTDGFRDVLELRRLRMPRLYDLAARGTLTPGAAADVAIFDPATIAETGTVGQRNGYASGIRAVLANGAVAFEETGGGFTERRTGHVLGRADGGTR